MGALLGLPSPPHPGVWWGQEPLGPSWGLHSCTRVGAGAGGGGQGSSAGSRRPGWQRQGLGTPARAGTGAGPNQARVQSCLFPPARLGPQPPRPAAQSTGLEKKWQPHRGRPASPAPKRLPHTAPGTGCLTRRHLPLPAPPTPTAAQGALWVQTLLRALCPAPDAQPPSHPCAQPCGGHTACLPSAQPPPPPPSSGPETDGGGCGGRRARWSAGLGGREEGAAGCGGRPAEAWESAGRLRPACSRHGNRPPHGRGRGRVWGAPGWLSEGASPRVRPRQSGRGALPWRVSAHPCLSFPTLQGL